MVVQRRPGGRSARVREQVHSAVIELILSRDWDQLSIPKVAENSGVHQATLYRRWGTVSAILSDAVSERLRERSPLPDTGNLQGDLTRWAEGMAADLASSEGRVFLRAALAVGLPLAESADDERPSYLLERSEGVRLILGNATKRGEFAPSQVDIFELVIAPIYAYSLFNRPIPRSRIDALVDRALNSKTS
ncbi:TetR/AcrR family transcriptional regulator [Paramicrobacterium chengjingii]|uniref:TetR/AcrR family transcriptional regulator n=1 Tax=Paramicrobacterium chengjingii TaxID=2769067 RepID=UPI00141DDFCF